MWVARGGPPGSEVLFYRYDTSRGADAARQLIGDFQGFLQTDGCEVYDLVCKERPQLDHVGCLAHVRREFTEAKKNSKKAGSAEEALAMIDKLYAVEHQRAAGKDEHSV